MHPKKFNKTIAGLLAGILFILIACAAALLISHNHNIESQNPKIEKQPNNSYSRTLRVSGDYNYDPYTFYDSNSTPSGHDVELIYELADRMGYNVELSLMPWGEALASLKNRSADLLLTAAYSSEESSGLLLSIPLVNDQFVAFGTAPYTKIGELYGKRLAVLEGTGCISGFLKPYRLMENTTEYASISEVFASLQDGECDYAIVRYSVGRRAMASLPDSGIKAVGPTLLNNYVCIGVHPSQSGLLEEVNNAIISVSGDGTLSALSEKWLGNYVGTLNFTEFLHENIETIIYIAGAIALVILFSLLIIRRSFSRKKESEFKRLAERDQLTGIYNRAACDGIIRETLNASDPAHDIHALLIIDIDNFKAINDNFGHMEGDATLSRLADGLSSIFRTGDIVGRLGGDEFFVFMAHCTDKKAPLAKMKKIGELFSNAYRLNDTTFCVSASVGIAMYPEQGVTFTELYRSADDAMYEAKRRGKNGYALLNDAGEYTYSNFNAHVCSSDVN
ncbi:MAG: GGDEF domain-containing protein [Dehalococcoidales bacterium]|nr:GGDEF domain-containing protein [Dehalococcoidales bacterium]